MGTLFMEMRQRGQMTLTPRLQQSVRLLQLSALEFAQELQQALANNPFLEEIEDEPGNEVDGPPPATPDGAVDASEERIAPEEHAGDGPADDGGDASSDPFNDSQTSAAKARDDSETDWTEWTEATLTLHDHLRGQLQLCNLSERDRALCELLIEALDDDGYLRQSFDELAPVASRNDSKKTSRNPCYGARNSTHEFDLMEWAGGDAAVKSVRHTCSADCGPPAQQCTPSR